MNNTDIPEIAKKLLTNKGEQIRRYFQKPRNADWCKEKSNENIEKCMDDFSKRNFDHDEPWITLVALYGLFGNQQDINDERKTIINELFSEVFKTSPPHFDSLVGANIEVYLPEIIKYREYLKNTLFNKGAYHPYQDRKNAIKGKRNKENASFEGNTNLDALISGKSKGRGIHVFIEAKFLSDISKDITYIPVRNQIARNIDAAIDLTTEGGKNNEGLHDFWFVLLTPGIFRTEKYGGPVHSPIAPFIPERSRLYCYKMEDYSNPDLLRKDLPHLDKTNGGFLDGEQWKIISERIGWLTFEEIASKVISSKTLDEGLLGSFEKFFNDRAIISESN